jgi:hypothetical protein
MGKKNNLNPTLVNAKKKYGKAELPAIFHFS